MRSRARKTNSPSGRGREVAQVASHRSAATPARPDSYAADGTLRRRGMKAAASSVIIAGACSLALITAPAAAQDSAVGSVMSARANAATEKVTTLAADHNESPVITGNTNSVDDASVKQVSTCNNSVSLTIRRQSHNPYSDPPSDGPYPPVSGAQFVVSRVNGIDLTSIDGWKKASKLTVGQIATMPKTETARGTTDASGAVTFGNLPVGLYYVEEIPHTIPGYQYEAVEPFVVALPTRNAEGTAWQCALTLNPKSTLIPVSSPNPTPPVTTVPGTTTPNSPTPSGSETVPNHPGNGEPGGPGGPGEASGQPPSVLNQIAGSLASTGANVIWLIAAGLTLIAAGLLFLFLRRRREDEENA